jgi:hypothetical protein
VELKLGLAVLFVVVLASMLDVKIAATAGVHLVFFCTSQELHVTIRPTIRGTLRLDLSHTRERIALYVCFITVW